MQVTLAKALKVKNQVVGKLNRLQSYIQQHNRVLEVNKDKYDVLSKLGQHDELQASLVRLKQAIANANAPIQGVIVELAETKGLLSFFDDVSTDDAVTVRHGYNGERVEEKNYVHITEGYRATKMAELEKRIVELQDQLDTFNAVTKIEVDDRLVA